MTGLTGSSNFPTTLGAFQTSLAGGCSFAGCGDAFVSKLNAAGSALVFSTYLGGSSGFDQGIGIAVDSLGNVYVAGLTNSTDFPIVSPVQAAFAGGDFDAFVAKLNATGSALLFSTYLGGSGPDEGSGVAVDPSGNIFVGGLASTDFPTTPSAFQTAYGGGLFDAFVTKLTFDFLPPAISISTNPSTLWPPNGKSVPVTVSGTITDSGSGVNPSTPACKVVDEYGLVQPPCSVGPLGAGGAYSFKVSLLASREGSDKDGRSYTISVSASGYAGNHASVSTTVIVPHD